MIRLPILPQGCQKDAATLKPDLSVKILSVALVGATAIAKELGVTRSAVYKALDRM